MYRITLFVVVQVVTPGPYHPLGATVRFAPPGRRREAVQGRATLAPGSLSFRFEGSRHVSISCLARSGAKRRS